MISGPERNRNKTATGPPRSAPTVDEAYRGGKLQKQQPPSKKQRTQANDHDATQGSLMEDGVYVRNRKGKDLCKKFNQGSCNSSHKGNIICPNDQNRRHQCSKCLGTDHPAAECGSSEKRKGGGGGKNWGRGRK